MSLTIQHPGGAGSLSHHRPRQGEHLPKSGGARYGEALLPAELPAAVF